MTPHRGEVWLFDLGMAEKVRPALVVSVPYGDQDRALITIVPHTTSLRGSRYEIGVNVAFLKPGAFLVQNAATYPISQRPRDPKARHAQLPAVRSCIFRVASLARRGELTASGKLKGQESLRMYGRRTIPLLPVPTLRPRQQDRSRFARERRILGSRGLMQCS
jgi:mRNA interferase MazF